MNAFNLDALGARSDTPASVEESFRDKVQREGRELFASGAVTVFDPDTSRDAENPTVPGRVVIEPYTGSGFVGDASDPKFRLYAEQSDSWVKVLARVVAFSEHALQREPSLRVGQRVVFERCAIAPGKILVPTPSGGDLYAEFSVIHVADLHAVIEEDAA